MNYKIEKFVKYAGKLYEILFDTGGYYIHTIYGKKYL